MTDVQKMKQINKNKQKPKCFGTKNGYLQKCYEFHRAKNKCISIFMVEECYQEWSRKMVKDRK